MTAHKHVVVAETLQDRTTHVDCQSPSAIKVDHNAAFGVFVVGSRHTPRLVERVASIANGTDHEHEAPWSAHEFSIE